MRLRFWNDPETSLPHIYNHGVTAKEVLETFQRPGEEFPGRDDSRIRIGQTAAGRYLQIVFVPDFGSRSAFVVTAFELSHKAKQAFRRRQRRKQR
jgi:hypothetical protein